MNIKDANEKFPVGSYFWNGTGYLLKAVDYCKADPELKEGILLGACYAYTDTKSKCQYVQGEIVQLPDGKSYFDVGYTDGWDVISCTPFWEGTILEEEAH